MEERWCCPEQQERQRHSPRCPGVDEAEKVLRAVAFSPTALVKSQRYDSMIGESERYASIIKGSQVWI
jgi:hypothetical protein